MAVVVRPASRIAGRESKGPLLPFALDLKSSPIVRRAPLFLFPHPDLGDFSAAAAGFAPAESLAGRFKEHRYCFLSDLVAHSPYLLFMEPVSDSVQLAHRVWEKVKREFLQLFQ